MTTIEPSPIPVLAPFEVVNPDGKAPILITCDHAENHIPDDLERLGLDPDRLGEHIAYDIGAKQVAIQLSKRFDAPLLLAKYSRLVVDLNRFPDDPSLIPSHSDGHQIRGNQGLAPTDRGARIARFFTPYHHKHQALVDQLVERHSKPLIFAVHSFTPIMNDIVRPWHYGVLWDRCAALGHALADALEQDRSLIIGRNQPYNAVEPKGYSLNVHAQDRDIPMGLIEIRQDLIVDKSGQHNSARIVGDALAYVQNGAGWS